MNSFATLQRSRLSVSTLWICNVSILFSLEFVVVERRYVFSLRRAENDRSLKAFAAGITSIIFAILMTSFIRSFFASGSACKNLISSLIENEESGLKPSEIAISDKFLSCVSAGIFIDVIPVEIAHFIQMLLPVSRSEGLEQGFL